MTTGAGETRSLAGTALHVGRGRGGNGGEVIVGDLPLGGFRGAVRGWGGGLGAAKTGGVGSVFVGGFEVGELVVGGGGVAVDGDETVVVAFFRVLVDETARKDAGHFGAVKGSDFFEGAVVGYATVFRHAKGGLER